MDLMIRMDAKFMRKSRYRLRRVLWLSSKMRLQVFSPGQTRCSPLTRRCSMAPTGSTRSMIFLTETMSTSVFSTRFRTSVKGDCRDRSTFSASEYRR